MRVARLLIYFVVFAMAVGFSFGLISAASGPHYSVAAQTTIGTTVSGRLIPAAPVPRPAATRIPPASTSGVKGVPLLIVR